MWMMKCTNLVNFMFRILLLQIHTSRDQDQSDAQQECVDEGGNLVIIDELWKLDYIRSILESCEGINMFLAF